MPTRQRARPGLGLAFLALFAVAAPTAVAADAAVSMRDIAFSPRTVTIRVGDRVTWTNRDAVEHTATARNGSFDTGLFGEGESRSMRFSVAGTYRYLCTPHPNMTGTIVVRAASGGLQPPNTDTEPIVEAETSDGLPVAGLAILGGLAFLFAGRTLRRRRPVRER